MRLVDISKLVFMSLPLAMIGQLGCVDGNSPATDSVDQDLVGAPVDHGDAWAVGVCAGPLNEDPAAGPIGAERLPTLTARLGRSI